jgi:hypothetical protein
LHEGSSVFCEPGDVAAWDQTLRELLADEPSRLALGAQAQKDVAGYTWLARAERALDGLGK